MTKEQGPIVIRTQRMVLRPLTETDRAEYIRLLTTSHDHFAPWWPSIDPSKTMDTLFDEQISRTQSEELTGAGLRRVGVLHDGPMAVLLNLSQIVRGPFQNAFCGWSVGVDFIGRGLATEAVWAMLDAAFTPVPNGLGLHRVQANVIPTNSPSLRVAEKCGFRKEGIAKSYLQIAGAWQDHLMFAKTADEHQVRYEVSH